VISRTSYLINETPPYDISEKGSCLYEYRNFEEDTKKFTNFKKKEPVLDISNANSTQNTPPSQNTTWCPSQNTTGGPSQNTTGGPSQNTTVKNNIILLNNIISETIVYYKSIYPKPYPPSFLEDQEMMGRLINHIDYNFIVILDNINIIDFSEKQISSIVFLLLDLYTSDKLIISGQTYFKSSIEGLLKRLDYFTIFKSTKIFEEELNDITRTIKNPKDYLKSIIINTALDNQSLDIIEAREI